MFLWADQQFVEEQRSRLFAYRNIHSFCGYNFHAVSAAQVVQAVLSGAGSYAWRRAGA